MAFAPAKEGVTFAPVGHSGTAALATPWALFIIFVFGPCEPLIPVLMYPAAHANWLAVTAVCLAFGLATIGTMLAMMISPVVVCSQGRMSWLVSPSARPSKISTSA